MCNGSLMVRAAATLLCCLVLPSSAAASWPRVGRAQSAAVAHWGAWPADCPTVWTLRVDVLPYYYSAPPPSWIMSADGAPFCVVYIRRGHTHGWGDFCMRYLHEWGHLLGRKHSSNPRALMYHAPSTEPKEC